jgi:ATP-binding cassette subfamily B (MDR/TAP) protein 1
LDEATSALDPKAERIVQEALDNVSSQRTILVIAHKLSTVKKADSIAVMIDGVIVEQGTHDELVALKDGHYARLLKAQDLGEHVADDNHDSDNEKNGTSGEDIEKPVPLLRTETEAAGAFDPIATNETTTGMKYGLLKCLAILLKEQKHLLPHFIIILITCILGGKSLLSIIQSYIAFTNMPLAGITTPAVAIIFAKLIAVFQFPRDQMIDRGNFYSLMFFVLALGIFMVYFTLGWLTNIVCQVNHPLNLLCCCN